MAVNKVVSMTDLRLLMRVSILCGGSEDFVTGGVAEIQSVPLLPTLQYKSTPGSKGSQRLAINIPQVPLQVVQEQLGELLTTEQIDALIPGQDTLELVMNNNAGEAGPSGSITSIEYLP